MKLTRDPEVSELKAVFAKLGDLPIFVGDHPNPLGGNYATEHGVFLDYHATEVPEGESIMLSKVLQLAEEHGVNAVMADIVENKVVDVVASARVDESYLILVPHHCAGKPMGDKEVWNATPRD